MNKHLIDIAYDYAKDTFNKNPFTFKELFSGLVQQDPLRQNEIDDFYIQMIQDIRFLSLGQEKWGLRENYTLNEINRINASIFGLEEYYEADAEKYMSEFEKRKRLESEEERLADVSEFVAREDAEEMEEYNEIRSASTDEDLETSFSDDWESSDASSGGDFTPEDGEPSEEE